MCITRKTRLYQLPFVSHQRAQNINIQYRRQIYVSPFIRCVSKFSRAENVSGSCQSLDSDGGTQCTRSSSNSGLNVVKIRLYNCIFYTTIQLYKPNKIMFHVIY